MKKNNARVYELKEDLRSCRQRKDMTVCDYYNKLKTIWEDLATYQQKPNLCLIGGSNCQDLETSRNEERLHQFLLGLDASIYTNVKNEILDMDPLPSLEQAYSMVFQDEENRVSSNQELSGELVVDVRNSVNVEEDSVETVDTSLGVTVKKDEDFGQWYS